MTDDCETWEMEQARTISDLRRENERLKSIISGKTFPLEDPRVAELKVENERLRDLLRKVLAGSWIAGQPLVGIGIEAEIRKAVRCE